MKFAIKLICSFFLFNFLVASEISKEEKAAFENEFCAYLETLKNLDLENPPLIISFSGAPGMGKTKLSKILEEKLGGLRISSDSLRSMLKKYNFFMASSKKDLLENSLFWGLSLLDKHTKNHLIILDKSLDRDFEVIADWAKKNNYPLFVIRLDLSKEETKKRLLSKENSENYLKFLDKWYNDYQNFDLKNANYVLDASSSFDNIDDLLQKIKSYVYLRNK